MFTPSEILAKQFKTGIGYDKKDVDQFLNDLTADYSTLQSENDRLGKKLRDLDESLSYYRSIEKTLQKALILAEKTSQDTKATAMREADSIELEAKAKAKLILADSKRQVNLLEHKTVNLIQQYDMFKIQFENLLNSQLTLLNSKSFSVDTAEFLYKEMITPENSDLSSDVTEAKHSDIISPDASIEDTEQFRFDFMKQPEAASYKTEDGFEFFTMKDE